VSVGGPSSVERGRNGSVNTKLPRVAACKSYLLAIYIDTHVLIYTLGVE
jgi:hypothetical protein